MIGGLFILFIVCMFLPMFVFENKMSSFSYSSRVEEWSPFDLKPGMFVAVKSDEPIPPNILRLKESLGMEPTEGLNASNIGKIIPSMKHLRYYRSRHYNYFDVVSDKRTNWRREAEVPSGFKRNGQPFPRYEIQSGKPSTARLNGLPSTKSGIEFEKPATTRLNGQPYSKSGIEVKVQPSSMRNGQPFPRYEMQAKVPSSSNRIGQPFPKYEIQDKKPTNKPNGLPFPVQIQPKNQPLPSFMTSLSQNKEFRIQYQSLPVPKLSFGNNQELKKDNTTRLL